MVAAFKKKLDRNFLALWSVPDEKSEILEECWDFAIELYIGDITVLLDNVCKQ